MTDQPKHLFLIDGSGFLFRAFHALPPMTRDDGTPVNAVFGFTKMVMKLIDDTDADYIAVIFDRARKTFRSEIYADYKANRPPPPDELIPQFQLVRNATEAMNVPAIDMDGFEADDLIATYARQAAEAGLAPAQLNLGVLYAQGEGVQRDLVEAWVWFNLAASKDQAQADAFRSRLDRIMSEEQRQRARAVAKERRSLLGVGQAQ